MGDEPLFALTHDWWTWDHARVRAALQVARFDHLSRVVAHALEENRRCNRRPSSWRDLCDEGRIRRDPHNLMKIKRGQYTSSELVVLGISTGLGIDLRKLIPSTEDWIAQAAVALTNGRIQLVDARAYVEARLGRTFAGASQSANGHSQGGLAVSVTRSVRVLDEVLTAIDHDLNGR